MEVQVQVDLWEEQEGLGVDLVEDLVVEEQEVLVEEEQEDCLKPF
jgi:hypothetical protein